MGSFSPPNNGNRRNFNLTMNVTDGVTARALTEVVDLGGWRPVAIITDTAWTAASMHFKGHLTSQTVLPIYDSAGEVLIASAGIPTATQIVLALTDLEPALGTCRFFQIGSGTNASPVAQGAARSLILIAVSAE